MNTLIISYDLPKDGQKYYELSQKIKSLGPQWCHPLESFWIVQSFYSVDAAKNILMPALDFNDKLIIIQSIFKLPFASKGLEKDLSWLNINL